MPVLTMSPTISIPVDPKPIRLSLLQHGGGHYDTVCWQESPSSVMTGATSTTEHNTTKCTCERKITKEISCALLLDQYSTKCPCYKAGLPCTQACTCKECQNPHGTRTLASSTQVRTGKKRMRETFDTQKYLLKGIKTKKFI